MTIKYRTSKYSVEIKEVEVERETDHSVWVKGNRSAKHSDWHQYHETYNEAFNFLDCRYTQKLSAAESRLDTAKNEYSAVQELKK
jgi:hypothetical protein